MNKSFLCKKIISYIFRFIVYLILHHYLFMQIRHRFGCYDEVQEVDCRRVRHCNWIRFLRCSSSLSNDVNLIGSLVKGEPVFETIRTVPSNTELVVFFENGDDMEDSALRSHVTLMACRSLTAAHYRHAMGIILEGQ